LLTTKNPNSILKLFIRAASLGGDHSLAVHPITTTHAQMTPEDKEDSGIVDELVRISVGLEDVEDLIRDLEAALKTATGLSSI
jgi:cystathionine beta-lyase/cystathionine gamma-synthase